MTRTKAVTKSSPNQLEKIYSTSAAALNACLEVGPGHTSNQGFGCTKTHQMEKGGDRMGG